MTGKRKGPDTSIVDHEIARLSRMLNGPWDLPIIFEREGEMLVGKMDMAVRVDLSNMGRVQAEDLIRSAFKSAIISKMRP